MADAEKMNVDTYCVLQKQSKLVAKLISIHLAEKKDLEVEKTMSEWDAIRKETMSQVAH